MPLPQESVKTEESSQGQLEFRIQRAEAVRDSEDENSAPAFPDFSRQEAPMEKEEIPAAYQDEPEEEIPETIIPEIQSEPVEETPDEEEDAYQGADWQEQLKREVRPEHTAEVQTAEQPAAESTTSQKKNPKSSEQEIQSGITNIQKEITSAPSEVPKEYHYPPLKLLKRGDGKSQETLMHIFARQLRNYRKPCTTLA